MSTNLFSIIVLSCIIAGCNSAVLDSSIGNAFSVKRESKRSSIEAMGSNLCLAEHNRERQNNKKASLVYNDKLEQAAINHNKVMTSQNCFSHQCNNEPSVGDRVSQTGYHWSTVGENIAAGQNDCTTVMKGWMNSSGHKANILNGNFKNVGCARQECSSCTYKVYWTCVFGTLM